MAEPIYRRGLFAGSASAAGAAGTWSKRYGDVPLKEGQRVSLVDLSAGDVGDEPQALHVQLSRRDQLFGTSQLDPVPNADVRARVTTELGNGGARTFVCDWRGSFSVCAQRLLIEAEGYKDGEAGADFEPGTHSIDISASAARAVMPSELPTLTYSPTRVEQDEFRYIPIPALAVRVGLLLQWGLVGGEGDATDAPLAQVIVNFARPAPELSDTVVTSWIDAFNGYDLLGRGVHVPPSSETLVLANRSPYLLALGAVFYLAP